jgi:hypothetical protein
MMQNNMLYLILVILIVLIISFTIINTEYFGVKIVGCNCAINPSCDQECPNYVSPYLDLSNF